MSFLPACNKICACIVGVENAVLTLTGSSSLRGLQQRPVLQYSTSSLRGLQHGPVLQYKFPQGFEARPVLQYKFPQGLVAKAVTTVQVPLGVCSRGRSYSTSSLRVCSRGRSYSTIPLAKPQKINVFFKVARPLKRGGIRAWPLRKNTSFLSLKKFWKSFCGH